MAPTMFLSSAAMLMDLTGGEFVVESEHCKFEFLFERVLLEGVPEFFFDVLSSVRVNHYYDGFLGVFRINFTSFRAR